jgi:hypothetical protein
MAWGAKTSERIRGWLVTLMIAIIGFGKVGSINFVSMETYRGPDRGFEVTLTDLVAIAFIWLMITRYKDRIVWFPYNSFWLLALWLIACISTINAMDRLVAAFSLWKWARAYMVYWSIVNIFRVPFPRIAVWRALLIMALYMTVLALKQKYVDHVYRIPGPFDHSNTVPLFLNQFLPVLSLWCLTDKRLSNGYAALSLIACLGLCVASQSTFSRLGSSLSLIAFLLTLVVANFRDRTPRVRITTMIAVISIIVGGLLAMPSIIARINSAPEESEEARKEFNLAAKSMANDYLFGIGVNNFPRVLTKVGRYNQYISVMEDEEQSGVCHHIYNLTAAELGKPGLFVFVVILLRFLWRNVWGIFRGPKDFQTTLLFGFLFGALALHISGFAEWVFRITPVTYTYAICAGMMVAFSEFPQKRPKAVTP